jgi:hypothetical protein
MADRYKLKNGNILDKSCGDTGHTMFLEDVVKELNRKAFLEQQAKGERAFRKYLEYVSEGRVHVDINPDGVTSETAQAWQIKRLNRLQNMATTILKKYPQPTEGGKA